MNMHIGRTRVRVRLTPAGRAQHMARFAIEKAARGARGIKLGAYIPPVENLDGTSDWTLWSLMHNFGAMIQPGPEHPLMFDPVIEIDPPSPIRLVFPSDPAA